MKKKDIIVLVLAILSSVLLLGINTNSTTGISDDDFKYSNMHGSLGLNEMMDTNALGTLLDYYEAEGCGPGNLDRIYTYEDAIIYTSMASGDERVQTIKLTNDSKTNRGIKIGSTLQELKTAYPEIALEDNDTYGILNYSDFEINFILVDGIVNEINYYAGGNIFEGDLLFTIDEILPDIKPESYGTDEIASQYPIDSIDGVNYINGHKIPIPETPFVILEQPLEHEYNDELVSLVDDILNEIITEDMTTLEKAQAWAKYSRKHYSYIANDDQTFFFEGSENLDSYALKLAKYRTGACFDFAALSACAMSRLDIPVIIVKGFILHIDLVNFGEHCWNLVCIDDEWLLYDPLYDRYYPSAGKYYFVKSSTLYGKMMYWDVTKYPWE